MGGKVTVLRKGWVVTSNITGTPSAGDVAYVGDAGTIMSTAADAASSGALAIGRFLSSKDEDDYCKVEVNLPNHGYAN